jgi:hypothetical protein
MYFVELNWNHLLIFCFNCWVWLVQFIVQPNLLLQLCWWFNHFLFIKNKQLFISSQGFSSLVETPWYVIRGQCCPSSWVWQSSADSNGSLTPFLGRMWQPSADKNCAPKGISNCKGLSHLTRKLSKCQECPKGRKGTLGMISRQIQNLEFKKKPRCKKTVVRKSRYSLA